MSIKMTTENIITLVTTITSVIGLIALLNENVRTFILRSLNMRKSESELRRDAANANDAVMTTMLNRINSLSDDFIRLSEQNTNTQKENFELKSRINSLENECEIIKTSILNKCINKCLDT
jgi:archaellum component FlaC